MPVSVLDNLDADGFPSKPKPNPKVPPKEPQAQRRVLPPIPDDDEDEEKTLDMDNPLEMFLDESDLTPSSEDEQEIQPPQEQESSEPIDMHSHIEMNSDHIYLDIFSEPLWEQTKKVLILSDEGQRMLSEIQEEIGVLVNPDERETRCLALIRHALSQHQDQKALEITISVTAKSQYKLSL